MLRSVLEEDPYLHVGEGLAKVRTLARRGPQQ